MRKGLSFCTIALAALFAIAAPAAAQVLQVSVTAGGTTSNVAAGGSVSLTATGTGQAALATVTVKYTGSTTASISSVTLTGTSEMTLLSVSTLPIVLTTNATTTFTVQYLPTTGTTVNGQISLAFTENNQASSFGFTVTGTSPRLAFSYFFTPSGALTNLNSGDNITFPATNVGSTSLAVVNILNLGTAPGTVQSVTLSGPVFQLGGNPAPITLQPGQQSSFNVTFSPQSAGANQGLLVVGLGNSSATFTLTGAGTTSSFAFTYTLSDGNVHPLTDGVVISFPSVDINGTTTATIDIINQGTGAGTVSNISLSGAGFRLSGLPLLPATISAGGDIKFGIVFAPTQTGAFSGAFSISLVGRTISGSLAASTNSPNLTASYTLSDGISRTLANGTLITYPVVDVNATTTATVTISNPGTGTGQLTSVGLSGAGFRLAGVPLLPANVAPAANLQFSVIFAPTSSGTFTGTLQINMSGQSFTISLSGSTTTPNFTVTYTLSDGVVHPLTNGTAISFPAVDINATTTATIDVINQGNGAGQVTTVLAAGTGFKLTGVPVLPTTVNASQDLKFGIVFAPTQSGAYTGTFRIDLGGNTITGTLSASTAAANITLAYVDPNTNNVVGLSDGSALPFPDTLVNTSTTITLVATNTGAGTGSINSVALGSATSPFQVLNLPSLPVSVPPSQAVRFAVRFSPLQQQAFSATLLLNLNGQSLTVNLQAQGTGALFSYTTSTASGTNNLLPGGTFAVADTTVGQTTNVTITILNAGNGDGQISVINVTGQGFALANLPALPVTLHSKGTQSFTLSFAPTQPGAINGTLTIGTDTFTVTGNGLGSRLIYTYTNAASAVTVTDGGVVIFPPTAVESTITVNFSIQNTGTTAATISSINLAAPSTIFTLQQLPGLPANLNPGDTMSFPISFVPNNTGTLTATLHVNTAAFTLSGTGTPPASLPAYQFQGPSGTQAPAQQPSIGLTLASAYPLAVQGTLTLTFVSAVFTDDPSIQFATGGRTVNFTIPANTTKALFNGTATALPLQSGTTAGNIVITPSFATQGGYSLTPPSPTTLTLTIARSAPQLTGGSITSETLSSFTLILSGYTTTRGLQTLNIQITPKQGSKFSTSQLTVDVSSAATSWFQGTTSQTFGGSFLIAIPFTLQNGSSTNDLVHSLQSLSITAVNDAGTSNALSVTIP